MDKLDFAIYRYMFPRGEGRFWGSQSIVDPRISSREIASHVGLSEVAVRGRISRLRHEGVLGGYEVWPNPRLFGVTQLVLELPARDTDHADRILRSLPRIHGVLSARLMIDEDVRRVRVSFVQDVASRTQRRTREILRLTDLPSSAPTLQEWLPPVTRTLGPLDWRVISELRRAPELSIEAHARRLGLTPKTVGQRFHWLLDSNAVFWTLITAHGLLPVAACFVDLVDPGHRESVWQSIQTRIVDWLPTAPGGLGEPPHPPPPWIAALFWIPSPAATEDLARDLIRIPGVRSVRRRFPSSAISIPNWFDAQLAAHLGSERTVVSEFDFEAIASG